MGKEYPRWLVGCGVGCLAVVVVLFILGLGGFLAARKVARGFQEAQQAVSKVEGEFGSPDAYSPEPDGRIPAERIEAFLAVREATSPIRVRLGTRLEELDAITGDREPQRKSGLGKLLAVIRTGVGAIPRIAEFEQKRADALIANRMGLGEYWYIYSLAYYSSLKKDPGDGPRRLHTREDGTMMLNNRNNPEEIRESRDSRISREVNRLFRRILGNAVRDAKTAEKSAWLLTVEKEINALEERHERIPWGDGPPPEIEESVRPFKEQLERSYDSTMNPLEFLKFGDDRHRW